MDLKPFKHILIVGGTGILRGVTTHFIEKGFIVSVLARNEKRLKRLKEEYPIKKGRIWTISQDYRDTEKALAKVKEAADMFVHIDMALLWIHEIGRQFSNEVKDFLFSHHSKTKVYHLWGSSGRNPLEMSRKKWRKSHPDRYREIFLGYERNGKSSRWLTDRKISEGTIRAIENDMAESVVGQIIPWHKKP